MQCCCFQRALLKERKGKGRGEGFASVLLFFSVVALFLVFFFLFSYFFGPFQTVDNSYRVGIIMVLYVW